jgi:N-acetylglutamate synthase-like GNAT family acetyltransferase
VIGTIGLKDIGAGQTALRKMFVAAPFRGREFGVAAQLLNTLLEEAWQRGVKEIYLGTTDKFLAAHRFYEKHGFVEVAKQALPESFPVMKVDSKFYVLRRE